MSSNPSKEQRKCLRHDTGKTQTGIPRGGETCFELAETVSLDSPGPASCEKGEFQRTTLNKVWIYEIGNVVFSGLNPVHVILFTIPNQ